MHLVVFCVRSALIRTGTCITWSSGETCLMTSAHGRWMILTSRNMTVIKLFTGTTGWLTANTTCLNSVSSPSIPPQCGDDSDYDWSKSLAHKNKQRHLLLFPFCPALYLWCPSLSCLLHHVSTIMSQGANSRGGPTPPGGAERKETQRGPSKEGGPSWCSHYWCKLGFFDATQRCWVALVICFFWTTPLISNACCSSFLSRDKLALKL